VKGPCLCGDPYCPSCGNPGAAEFEEAENWASERLYKHCQTPEEIRLVITVGLVAMRQARRAAEKAVAAVNAINGEAAMMIELDKAGKEWERRYAEDPEFPPAQEQAK
jgi:hypothetical protein